MSTPSTPEQQPSDLSTGETVPEPAPRVPDPTPAAAAADGAVTLQQLALRRLRTCPGPSGIRYTVRAVNLQRHALAGNFPAGLRDMAVRQALGVSAVKEEDTPDAFFQRAGEMGAYLDEVVRQVIVQPDLTVREGTEDPLELIPPADYDWAVGIATGEITTDGDGNPIFADRPPAARFPEAADV